MAYNKHTWVARQGVGLNKFTDQNGNRYEFTPSPDEVTQPGTPFSAVWMNEMEEQLEKAAVLNGGAVEGNFPMFNALGELVNSGKGPNILQYVNNVISTLNGETVSVGDTKIATGSYVGDGTATQSEVLNKSLDEFKSVARKITLPFVPKILFIYSPYQHPVFLTVLLPDVSHLDADDSTYVRYLSGNTFYCSAHKYTVTTGVMNFGCNTSGYTYHWIAFAQI